LDYVVEAVVADFGVAAVFVHALHFRAVDVHFARHADELGKRSEARHSAGAVVGEHVGQVHMAFVAEPVAIVGAPAAAGVIRWKLHAVLEHAIGKHGQIKPPPVEGDHRRVPLPDEVGELLQDFGLIGWGVFLATEGAQLQQLVIMIEPQHAERDHLVKRRRWKTIDRCVPCEIRVRNGFDVEDEERASHGLKLAEKCRKIPRVKTRVRFESFTS
jgi:hypothetical protein